MELLGYAGGIFLAISAIPEAIRTIKDKKCHIGWSMLILWFIGEVFMLVYSFLLMNIPLLVNYVLNFFIINIMLWYKIRRQYRLYMGYTQEYHTTEYQGVSLSGNSSGL